MRVIGLKTVPIAKLILPGHWRKTLDDPSIPARARSQKIIGIIHEPVVRKRDMKLGPGSRRVAAALHNGETEITVKMVDCTDEELDLMCHMENAYRQHLTPEEQKQAVDELAQRIAALSAQDKATVVEKPTRGRLKLPTTVAVEIVAQAQGVKPEAVRKTLQRRARRKEQVAAATDHDADLGIRSPWVELDDDFRHKTNKVVAGIHEIAQLLARAQGRMTVLADSGLPLHASRLNRVREDLALCAKTLRGLIPVCLCPHCKGVDELQKRCLACMSTGYITENQEEGVPTELWAEDKPVVYVKGRLVSLDTFYEKELAEEVPDPEPGNGEWWTAE